MQLVLPPSQKPLAMQGVDARDEDRLDTPALVIDGE
jgi:hypothetical protein